MQATHKFICELAEKISMPEVYRQIRRLMQDQKAKIEDYEQLIKTDFMLANRIMRIAESNFFGFNQQVSDLYEAISLIGIIQLHDLLLSSLSIRTFYNIPVQLFDVNNFWRHSVRCGIASRRIARLCLIPANNRFFTLGLLADIGHAAMFIQAPDLSLTVMEDTRNQQESLGEIEHRYFGFDYCQLGATIMRQWHLPEVYPQVIEYHITPEQSGIDFRDTAKIVNLAYRFCEDTDYRQEKHYEKLLDDPLFSNFPENFREIILEDINENCEDVFKLLAPSLVSDGTLVKKEIKP